LLLALLQGAFPKAVLPERLQQHEMFGLYCTLGPEGYMPFDSVMISKLATEGRKILEICVYPHRLQKRSRSHFDPPTHYYVLVIDLGDAADPMQYFALNGLMCEFGFTLCCPETQRPAQFSRTSALPVGELLKTVADRIKIELQADASVDAYEIKQLVQFSTPSVPHCRRFHYRNTRSSIAAIG
jgi:hypothetical protein